MQRLITLLQNLERDDSIQTHDFIVDLANRLLITNKGECNYKNITILKKNNFSVFPIEVDSYGWLIAGINTKKGIIVYG